MSYTSSIDTQVSRPTLGDSATRLLTRPPVRSGLLFVTIGALIVALENAVALPYVIQAFLTDMGPNSLGYSMAAAFALAICLAGVLTVSPTARQSVNGDVQSIGILFFSATAWMMMIWGDVEGVTTPTIPVSFAAAAFVIAATAACCFAETFTSADNVGSRLRTAARNSVFFAGVAGWMLTLVFAIFGSFVTDVMVADIEENGLSLVRSPTLSEMQNLSDCKVSDSRLVLCLLPPGEEAPE